ncbi:MAG: 50S ribosomal protein L11 methyltransferase [Nannocystaceae bacterium]
MLDDVAAMLASVEGIAGVETRDPRTIGGPQTPQLVVYTAPEFLDRAERHAAALMQDFGLRGRLRAEVRTDDDWRDAWKQFYRAQILGQRQLLLRPSWIAREPGDPEVELVLDPGRAFGTGLHETTQLCLDRICALARGPAPARVLDLGCGSGILALATARLLPGAAVVAIDDDPEAVETTHENAIANELQARIELRTGDVDALGAAQFDLVLANIRAQTLIPRAGALASLCRSGGAVVLSGILDDERDQVARAYVDAGFVRDPEVEPWPRQRGEWVAIDLRRAP